MENGESARAVDGHTGFLLIFSRATRPHEGLMRNGKEVAHRWAERNCEVSRHPPAAVLATTRREGTYLSTKIEPLTFLNNNRNVQVDSFVCVSLERENRDFGEEPRSSERQIEQRRRLPSILTAREEH